jgi:hypothetical protein
MAETVAQEEALGVALLLLRVALVFLAKDLLEATALTSRPLAAVVVLLPLAVMRQQTRGERKAQDLPRRLQARLFCTGKVAKVD